MPTPITQLLERDDSDVARVTPCPECLSPTWSEPGSPADVDHAARCQFNKEIVRVLSMLNAAELS